MGEWSPECISARWVAPAARPGVGARFEGENRVAFLGVTLKRWTTTSEVTAYRPGELFEFVAEEYTTWRYQLEPDGAGTKLTESYEYVSEPGARTFVYETLLGRPATMVKGMQRTLERIKTSVESQ